MSRIYVVRGCVDDIKIERYIQVFVAEVVRVGEVAKTTNLLAIEFNSLLT
jgi:hypothetical protein